MRICAVLTFTIVPAKEKGVPLCILQPTDEDLGKLHSPIPRSLGDRSARSGQFFCSAPSIKPLIRLHFCPPLQRRTSSVVEREFNAAF